MKAKKLYKALRDFERSTRGVFGVGVSIHARDYDRLRRYLDVDGIDGVRIGRLLVTAIVIPTSPAMEQYRKEFVHAFEKNKAGLLRGPGASAEIMTQ